MYHCITVRASTASLHQADHTPGLSGQRQLQRSKMHSSELQARDVLAARPWAAAAGMRVPQAQTLMQEPRERPAPACARSVSSLPPRKGREKDKEEKRLKQKRGKGCRETQRERQKHWCASARAPRLALAQQRLGQVADHDGGGGRDVRPEVHDDVVDPAHALVVRVLQPAGRVLLRIKSKSEPPTSLHAATCPASVHADCGAAQDDPVTP